MNLESLGRRFTDEILTVANTVEAGPADDGLDFINSRELLEADFRQEWHVARVLVRGQPAIFGGAKKTLKTSVLVDLAVSVATGLPFLGCFRVEQADRVGFISGESGGATIRETFRRICAAKSIECPADVDVHWGFHMPRLNLIDDLQAMAELIDEHQLAVLIIDPLYLGLLTGTQDFQASNLYQMGPLLSNVSRRCLDAGATPILVHHTKKQAVNAYNPPELEDLAFAGVQEFARQWLLVGRREQFEPGTGDHRLWLNVGGSAGHSGCWAVDVEEGQLRDDFSGRRWHVQVRTATDERQAAGDRREQERQRERREREQQDRQRIVEALRNYPDGGTLNQVRESAQLSGGRARPALDALVAEGVVERTGVQGACGRGTRTYEGYRLIDDLDEWETDDIDATTGNDASRDDAAGDDAVGDDAVEDIDPGEDGEE